MSEKSSAGKALDPAIIAGMAKAAQQQRQQGLHPAAAPSHLSKMLAAGIWVSFIGSMVAVFYFNR